MEDRREVWDVAVAAAIGGAIGTCIALVVGVTLLPCAIVGGALVSFLAYRPGEIRAAMRTMRRDIVAGVGTAVSSPRTKAIARKCFIVLWGMGILAVGSSCYALMVARHTSDSLITPFMLIGMIMLGNGGALSIVLVVYTTASVYLCKHTNVPAWPLQRFIWRKSDYAKSIDPRGAIYDRYPADELYDSIRALFNGEDRKDFSPWKRRLTLLRLTFQGVCYSAVAWGILVMIVIGLCIDAFLTLCLMVASRPRLAATSGGAVGAAIGTAATTLVPGGVVPVLAGVASGAAAGRVFARIRARIASAWKPAA